MGITLGNKVISAEDAKQISSLHYLDSTIPGVNIAVRENGDKCYLYMPRELPISERETGRKRVDEYFKGAGPFAIILSGQFYVTESPKKPALVRIVNDFFPESAQRISQEKIDTLYWNDFRKRLEMWGK